MRERKLERFIVKLRSPPSPQYLSLMSYVRRIRKPKSARSGDKGRKQGGLCGLTRQGNSFSSLPSSLLPTHSPSTMVSFYELLQAVSRSTITLPASPLHEIVTPSTPQSEDQQNSRNSIASTTSIKPSTRAASTHRSSIWTLEEGGIVGLDEQVHLTELSRLLQRRFAEGIGGVGGLQGSSIKKVRTILYLVLRGYRRVRFGSPLR